MELRYVGPKVEITKHGVDFDINKEDKYVYLNIAIQLIKALDHEYLPEKTYTYNVDSTRLHDHEIDHEVTNYCPNMSTLIKKAKKEASEDVDKLLERVEKNTLLTEEERQAYLKNIRMMREYMVQRSVNKTAYYAIVEQLAERLKSEHIDYVIVPMFQKFAHVLHSAQGVLKRQKFPIDSKMEVITKEGKLLFKLDVINQ